MSSQMSLWDTNSAIFSPDAADGLKPCDLRDGKESKEFGVGAAHALHFRKPAKKNTVLHAKGQALSRILSKPEYLSVANAGMNGSLTDGISGLNFIGSSASAALASCAANKLRARMAKYGSPEYELRWKESDMALGASISVLRASARRKSGKGFSGWASCQARDHNGNGCGMPLTIAAQTAGWNAPKASDGEWSMPRTSGRPLEKSTHLQTQVRMALDGWPMTRANDATGSKAPPNRTGGMSLKQVAGWVGPSAQDYSSGNKLPRPQDTGVPLSQQVVMAGWPTAMAASPATENYNQSGNSDSSRRTVWLVTGWNAPRGTDGSKGGPNQAGGALSADAAKSAFMIPGATLNLYRARMLACGALRPEPSHSLLREWIKNRLGDGWRACLEAWFMGETEANVVAMLGDLPRELWLLKRGGLNPQHSRWLMGFRREWCVAMIRAYRKMNLSKRKRPRKAA